MKKRAIWVGAGWLWATLNAGCQALPAEVVPDATAVLPDAAAVLPDAAAVMPDAETALPDATAVLPDAEAALPDATAVLPDAEAVMPDAVGLPDAAVPEPPPPASEPEPPPPASEPPPPAPIPDPGLPPPPELVNDPAGVVCEVVDAVALPVQPQVWLYDDCTDDPLQEWGYPEEWPPPLVPPTGIHRSEPYDIERDEVFGPLITGSFEWRWDSTGALFFIGSFTDWIDLSDPRSGREHEVEVNICRYDAMGRMNLSGGGWGFAQWDSFARRYVLDFGNHDTVSRVFDAAGNVVREMAFELRGPGVLDPWNLLPIVDGPWPTRDFHRGLGGRIEWVVDRLCRQDFPPVGIALTCDVVAFAHFDYGPRGELTGAEYGTASGVNRRQLVGGPCP